MLNKSLLSYIDDDVEEHAGFVCLSSQGGSDLVGVLVQKAGAGCEPVLSKEVKRKSAYCYASPTIPNPQGACTTHLIHRLEVIR